MTKELIENLKFFPGNARRGDVDLIAESLAKLGQFRPIVVNRGNLAPKYKNVICGGNHTTKAALQLGWTHIDVHWIDVDEDTAKRIVLVDNASNDKADYDIQELVELANSLPDLEATGFTDDELDAMLESLSEQFDDPTPPEEEETFGLVVECDDREERDTLKAQLISKGHNVMNA
ncbi:ParB N-terminal domain-containing protein [Corynebacterium glutamicum]|uniref:ParB N-terminal domain-containing protein n=1 Tax=Corynebacterium glutamicum TaxID=1718 RepID=UPI0002D2B110|nr:ParB/RepB/Spo0J family partition protein [Corynebacterium glutamicum]